MVAADLISPEFVAEALRSTRTLLAQDHNAAITQLRSKESEIQIRIDRFLELAAKLDSPGSVLRKVDDLERERLRIASEIARLEHENQGADAAATLTEANVSRMLSNLASELETSDREAMKDFLGKVLERVELDPNAMTYQLFYRISPTYRNKLASPRGAAPIPALRVSRSISGKDLIRRQFLSTTSQTRPKRDCG